MNRPKLSILVPVYNAGRFLHATMASIAGQSDPPDEVIVLDNHSTDNTEQIALEFAHLPGFHYASHQENMGAVANWIAIEALAASDYLMWLPGDDLLMPDCVARWRKAALAHPIAELYFAGRTAIDELGRHIPLKPLRAPLPRGEFAGGLLIDWMLDFGQPNIVAGTVVPRSEYRAVGGFDRRLRGAIDYDLYLRLAGRGPVYYEPEPNATSREHGGQWSKDVFLHDNMDADVLFAKIDEMPFLSEAQVRRFVQNLCDYARQYYARPLRDPNRSVDDIAAERERTRRRFDRWRSSDKWYAKFVGYGPRRWLSWIAWRLGGSRLGIRLMHRFLARAPR